MALPATKKMQNDKVGDAVMPPLRQDFSGMQKEADPAMLASADAPRRPEISSTLSCLATDLENSSKRTPSSGSCVQTLWFSFFFDGTGNNMDADQGTSKHSNVAKLYRTHKENDPDLGLYRIYIPGVGTYFREINDQGGSTLGVASGAMGTERLKWVLSQFDERMKVHIARAKNPKNAIFEINFAVFGFSRGAALARGFINRFVEKRCKKDSGGVWRLTDGGYPIRVRFMGLFDTVASVGLAMSANNTDTVGGFKSDVVGMVDERLNDMDYRSMRPAYIAFGLRPGADPAWGKYNGHADWGDYMLIPDMVEEVRHFVAAHEMRNSFPLDSISVIDKNKVKKPNHFFEVVYPGVHSDVGGSYRPGEGGKGELRNQKLGLIPLKDMYDYAIAKSVPFVPMTDWRKGNKDDFNMDEKMLKTYLYYMRKVRDFSILGDLFNEHMALYYAWRFRSIHRKEGGDKIEADNIRKNDVKFKSEEIGLNKEINILEMQNNAELKKMEMLKYKREAFVNNNWSSSDFKENKIELDKKIAIVERDQNEIEDQLLRAKAKLGALPKAGALNSMIDFYDKQLLLDAKSIHSSYHNAFGGQNKLDVVKKKSLRPHYKKLMEAYEAEFINHDGLKDQIIIDFFDNYVHDSLAGFAKDATLPSDPRVIYLGEDEKYKYAVIEDGDAIPLSQEERSVA